MSAAAVASMGAIQEMCKRVEPTFRPARLTV